jgi:hypothetical protein
LHTKWNAMPLPKDHHQRREEGHVHDA